MKNPTAPFNRHKLKFRWLAGPYAIVRLAPDAPVPDWATKGEFISITRTADELSIVCPAANRPAGRTLAPPLDLPETRRPFSVLTNRSPPLLHRAAF